MSKNPLTKVQICVVVIVTALFLTHITLTVVVTLLR